MTMHSQLWCAMVLALLSSSLAHGQCEENEVLDCSDGDCVPEDWIGDGYCDGVAQEYGADLCCYSRDGGDCFSEECMPSVCGDGFCQADENANTCPTDCDFCPDDPDKSEPGLCGCGVADTDTDVDGTPDCQDDCPEDPLKTAPGDCGCGSPDTGVFGDVDCDGDYDADDARLAMAEFGIIEAGACSAADINGDGVVDGMDLGAVLAAWGLPCGSEDGSGDSGDDSDGGDDGEDGDSCPVGEVSDCDGSGECWPETWIGDGYCDGTAQEYGADLCCYDTDGGDCTNYECS